MYTAIPGRNDGSVFGMAPPQGHIEGVQHQMDVKAGVHRPSDDASGEGIQNHGKVKETCSGRDIGNVGHPQLIGCSDGIFPIDQIGSRAFVPGLPCRSHTLASAHAHHAHLP